MTRGDEEEGIIREEYFHVLNESFIFFYVEMTGNVFAKGTRTIQKKYTLAFSLPLVLAAIHELRLL
jgi:hypothetical protein